MSKDRYPLCWPDGWKRTAPSDRKRAQFGKVSKVGVDNSYSRKSNISVFQAITRIGDELRRMDVDESNVVVSTNVKLRIDGMPRSDLTEPLDPGVAIYWKKGNSDSGRAASTAQTREQCMATDRYDRVADNLAALAATLDALRAIERHGGAQILDRAFVGLTALPEHAGGKSWRDVLEFTDPKMKRTAEMIRQRFLEIAKVRHPDKPGGSDEAFRELIWARDQALMEIGQ